MCLYTKKDRPYVAEKPIICYKELRMAIIKGKPYFFTPYMLKEITKSRILRTTSKTVNIPPPTERLCNSNYYVITKQAIHAYLDDRPTWMSDILVQSEIPKGARYWKGDAYSKGEIAASRIILKDVINSGFPYHIWTGDNKQNIHKNLNYTRYAFPEIQEMWKNYKKTKI